MFLQLHFNISLENCLKISAKINILYDLKIEIKSINY